MTKHTSSYQKMFRAAIAATLAAGAIVTVAPAVMQADAKMPSLTDIEINQDYYQDVMNLVERGIIKGFPDGTYKPNNAVTRGQAAKILASILNLDTENVVNPGFTDVKVTDEYYGPIAALAEAGIISGFTDNTFRQGANLKRSQMAKIITLGFDFDTETLTDTRFTDVKADDEFAGYVQSLLTNEVTKGTTPTSFSPHASVKRGQMASFVVRSEAAIQVTGKVVNITDDSVEFTSGTYAIPANLKGLFNEDNLSALEGAVVKFSVLDDSISKVSSIEINASGTSTSNVVLDGAGSTFAGSILISGDYVTLKDLTIEGDLEIGSEVKNLFNADNITVKGETILSDKASSNNGTANFSTKAVAFEAPEYQVISAVAADSIEVQIIFTNSTLESVSTWKENVVTIDFKGTTVVASVSINSDINLKADKGLVILEVTVSEAASDVTIDVDVDSFIVNSPGNVTISGTGVIKNAVVEAAITIEIKLTGDIGKLTIKSTLFSPDVKVTLGATTKVGNIVLPEGKTIEDTVTNYEEVKGNIDQVDNEDVDVTPAPGPVDPPAPETEQQKFDKKVSALVTAINARELGGYTITSTETNTLNVEINEEEIGIEDTIESFFSRGFYYDFITGLGVQKVSIHDPYSVEAISYIKGLLLPLDETSTLDQLIGKNITIMLKVNSGSALPFIIIFE